MSAFVTRPAARRAIKLLVGLLGVSGGGKTLSALLLARGIAGPTAKILLADTENGRGEIFCDMVPGGYDYTELQPPFTPDKHIELIDFAEEQGFDCLVLDSATHEWAGEGGYLDLKEEALQRMAGTDWQKRERCAMAAAGQAKPRHNKFVARICRSKLAVILCFRGKDKVKMEKEGTKTVIKKDDHLSAIQDSGLVFEMLIAGEVFSKEREQSFEGGFFRSTKHTHPDVLKLLPGENEQISIAFGERLAAWARGDSGSALPAAPQVSSPAVKALKVKVYNMTAEHHGKDQDKFWTYLFNTEAITAEEFAVRTLTEERWTQIHQTLEGAVQ